MDRRFCSGLLRYCFKAGKSADILLDKPQRYEHMGKWLTQLSQFAGTSGLTLRWQTKTKYHLRSKSVSIYYQLLMFSLCVSKIQPTEQKVQKSLVSIHLFFIYILAIQAPPYNPNIIAVLAPFSYLFVLLFGEIWGIMSIMKQKWGIMEVERGISIYYSFVFDNSDGFQFSDGFDTEKMFSEIKNDLIFRGK